MIVIVDMGATKTDWSFADGSTVIKTIQTKGFNPYFYSTGEIIEIPRLASSRSVEAPAAEPI